MVSIKNVAQVGAAGDLGAPVLNALISSGKFNVTVLVRSTSKATFPPSVKVVNVDYNSLASLTEALRGQDAVVSTVGQSGLAGQTLIIDAAVAAGVKRFLPSEFGADLDNPKSAKLPVFGYKIPVKKYLEEVAASNPSFTYTNVRNSAFLDWGLEKEFLVQLGSDKPPVYNGGDQLFSATTLASVGQAVVGVLEHPEETKNRAVYVEDIKISQNKIIALARKVAPEKKWEPVNTSVADVEKSSHDALSKGQVTMEVMVGFLFVCMFGEGYGSNHEKNDNALLGIAGNKTDADVEEILKLILKK